MAHRLLDLALGAHSERLEELANATVEHVFVHDRLRRAIIRLCLDKCSRSVLYAGGPPFCPPMPIFTPHQDAALTAASNWLKAARGRASIFRLFGYSGTGKTTLAKHLAEGAEDRKRTRLNHRYLGKQ